MPLKQKPDADRLFRELAGRYAELEGHALRQELGSRVTPVFPLLSGYHLNHKTELLFDPNCLS